MMALRGADRSRHLVSLRPGRIVDLASNVPTLAPRLGRLHLTMLGIRFRIPRYVWNVAKPRGGTASDEVCRSGLRKNSDRRSGHRKNSDQSDGSDKKSAHDDSPLSWLSATMLRRC